MAQLILKGIDGLKNIIGNRFFLLVCGHSFERLSIKAVIDEMPHVTFCDFTPNPLYEQVAEGVKVFRENRCEMIVAIGGGSAIDVAKCIKLFCTMDPNVNYLKQKADVSDIELIAVPTTAGTGSESTRHAVIYYDGEKQSISHPSIIPDVAFLEPSFLNELPEYQKKCTLLDALCQAIESWWSVNSTADSIGYSQKAIRAIKEYGKAYIFNYSAEVAEKILEAANNAGRAINITATTAAHAMSYKITSLYNVPHGHAVAVCMEVVWEYLTTHIDDCIDPRGAQYLQKTIADISSEISLEWYRQFIADLDMRLPISNKKEVDLNLLTESVNPVRLKNYPVAIDGSALRGMYERIIQS